MEKRDFDKWLSNFTDSISGYGYYVNFDKVTSNANTFKNELNQMSCLIGSSNIESDFRQLISKQPLILKCIPILLAVRGYTIKAMDVDGKYEFNFDKPNMSIDDYVSFMRKTGLFELIQNNITSSLFDYILGVEAGLDSNGRKNRGGHQMEDLVESYINKLNLPYYKEMYSSEIEARWGIDLSSITNQGDSAKRFDFVVDNCGEIYAFEVNFYQSSGSKLNETARSYKMIAQEAREIPNFHFIWITDGHGWYSVKHNLKETFEELDDMYCIFDLESGVLTETILEHSDEEDS